MIDHSKEQLLSFAQAAKRLPKRGDGKPVHPSTVARWTLAGIRGVTLETILIGNRRFTSVEACQRFFADLTTAALPPQQTTVSIASQTAADIKALEEAGV